MGTPHVFQLSHRTRSKLEVEFKRFKLAEEDKEKAYLLRALMEFCIYPPGNYKNIGKLLIPPVIVYILQIKSRLRNR